MSKRGRLQVNTKARDDLPLRLPRSNLRLKHGRRCSPSAQTSVSYGSSHHDVGYAINSNVYITRRSAVAVAPQLAERCPWHRKLVLITAVGRLLTAQQVSLASEDFQISSFELHCEGCYSSHRYGLNQWAKCEAELPRIWQLVPPKMTVGSW